MKSILLSLLLLCLFACHQSEQRNAVTDARVGLMNFFAGQDESIEMEPPRNAEPPLPPPPPGPDQATAPAKIIKKGNLSFQVENLEKSKTRVDSLLTTLNGYYEREQLQNEYYSHQYLLTIRLPASQFETLMDKLEAGTGKVLSKEISANDVTEEYVDIQIRLENKLAYLAQYQEILKKATTIKDILEVQEKIRAIEEEIDSRKGRLKFLNDKVNLSTLQLTLIENVEPEPAESPGIFSRVGEALGSGGESFVDFLIGLLYLWPFLIVVILFLVFRHRIFGIFRRKT